MSETDRWQEHRASAPISLARSSGRRDDRAEHPQLTRTAGVYHCATARCNNPRRSLLGQCEVTTEDAECTEPKKAALLSVVSVISVVLPAGYLQVVHDGRSRSRRCGGHTSAPPVPPHD